MTTELGEAQPTEAESFPEAANHSTPKQVKTQRIEGSVNIMRSILL